MLMEVFTENKERITLEIRPVRQSLASTKVTELGPGQISQAEVIAPVWQYLGYWHC